MAKKKPTSHHQQQQKEDQSQTQTQPQPPPPSITMDDSSVQTQTQTQILNLKNLNSMLLKETIDKRNQLETLTDAKQALQSKLDIYVAQNDAVRVSLIDAADKNAALEMERSVVLVYAEIQMSEMELRFDDVVAERNDMQRVVSERENDVVVLEREVRGLAARVEEERVRLRSVGEERDRVRSELECVVGEAEMLREKVLEGEVREKKVRLERDRLLEEEEQRERVIEELNKERDSVLRSIEEYRGLIDRLKDEVDVAVREKNEIERVKSDKELRIVALESEMKELSESLRFLREEAAAMRGRIPELEGSLAAAVAKGEWMEVEVRALVREKEEMEKTIEGLNERKDGVEKVLDMVRKELDVKQREIDEVVRARDVIEQAKAQLKNETEELEREVDRLRGVVEKLRDSCRDFEEKNKKLLSEVEHYRGSVDKAVIEKDNIRKAFDVEKGKVEDLMLQVAGMKEKIEGTVAELDDSRNEREKLIEKTKMMESQRGDLVSEMDLMQRSLIEAQKESNDLRAKVEFYCANSNMALTMLKNTSALVCKNKDDEVEDEVALNEKKLEEDIQPFAKELDVIKKAFKNKDEMVEDMKQQLESLHKSMVDAHKHKSFWTVISSATTIFAAALAAYAARGR